MQRIVQLLGMEHATIRDMGETRQDELRVTAIGRYHGCPSVVTDGEARQVQDDDGERPSGVYIRHTMVVIN